MVPHNSFTKGCTGVDLPNVELPGLLNVPDGKREVEGAGHLYRQEGLEGG